MDNDRIERVLRRVTTKQRRRQVIAVLLSTASLTWPAALRNAHAGRQPRWSDEPGPAPPKCAKLGGECFVNSDCCASGARCERAGRNTCVCKADRVKCAATCCAVGKACCDRCADLQTDPNNCGACFTACGADETCVAGSCTA